MTKKRRRILFLIFLAAVITILLYGGRYLPPYLSIAKRYSASCKLLTNDMNTPELVLDGQYLVLPFSLGDILDAGWKVTTTGELAEGEYTTIRCTKKNTRITLSVVNQGPTTCVNDPDLTVYSIAANNMRSDKDTLITKFGLCTRTKLKTLKALKDTYPDHILLYTEPLKYSIFYDIEHYFLMNDAGNAVIQIVWDRKDIYLQIFDPELSMTLEGNSYCPHLSYAH